MTMPEWEMKETSPLKTKWKKYIPAEKQPTLTAGKGKKPSYSIKKVRKYSGDRGRVRKKVCTGLGVSNRMCQVIADKANRLLVDNTIEGHIRKCGKELGRPKSFHFSRKDVLNLVGYFLKKGLKGETISNYLASVRAAHIYRRWSDRTSGQSWWKLF